MSFSAPIWLLGLIPWAAVTLWLLWGRRNRVSVPFLQLWKGPIEPPKAERAVQLPPFALGAAIAAMLLAVLAAARPAVRWGSHPTGPAVTIIVDRGITMSARGQSDLRYRELIDAASPAVAEAFQAGPVTLVGVPGEGRETDRDGWAAAAKALPPTAMESRSLVQAAVANALSHDNNPVIVLSDQPLGTDDTRVVQIAPETAPADVGIVRFTVRQKPSRQVMVRVRNQSSQSRASLRVLSDGREVARTNIELPSRGEQKDYFLDVPALGHVVTAELLVEDDLVADNRASLVREQVWPAIEPRASLPGELQRFIERYSRLRPSGKTSKNVAVVTSTDAMPSDGPGVAVIDTVGLGAAKPAESASIAVHPVTQSLEQWKPLVTATPAPPPSGAGWTPVVTVGGQVLVAVRDTPVRQVWAAMPVRASSTSTDFVIFWTNVFNWLGEGAEAFAAHRVEQLPEGWTLVETDQAPGGIQAGLWQGVYRQADGSLRAVNAADVQISPPPQRDWRGELARLASDSMPSGPDRPVAGLLLALALVAMLLSALTWRRRQVAPLTTPTPPAPANTRD